MILATIKATLVALIFMHLNHERSLIYKILLFTVVLVVVLFALFIFSHEDPLVFKGMYAPVEQQ
jgi:cytochrome c oxidase subunit IV